MRCPKCNELMKWDGLVRTSMPPMYMHKCPKCGYSEFLGTSEVIDNANTSNVNVEALKQLLGTGFDKLKPKIENMTHLMMDCYEQGFKDCWKVLTGKDF